MANTAEYFYHSVGRKWVDNESDEVGDRGAGNEPHKHEPLAAVDGLKQSSYDKHDCSFIFSFHTATDGKLRRVQSRALKVSRGLIDLLPSRPNLFK